MAEERQRGMSLWVALREYSDSNQWEACANAFQDGNHDQWKLLGDLWKSLKARLKDRELVATGFTGQIIPQEIPADAWSFLDPKTMEDLKNSVVSGGDTRVHGVRVNRLEKRPSSSIVAEKECRTWMVDLAESGHRPESRKSLFKEAQSRFGPRLSESAFRRVWAVSAPSSWKRPGRKPRS